MSTHQPAMRARRRLDVAVVRTLRILFEVDVPDHLPATTPADAVAMLAVLADMRGDKAQAAALRRAATALAAHGIKDDRDAPLAAAALSPDDVEAIDGLREVQTRGAWVLLELALAEMPSDLRRLFESDTVTFEQLIALHRTLDITTLHDLASALDEPDRLVSSDLEPVRTALEAIAPRLRTGRTGVPIGQATAIVDLLQDALRDCQEVEWVAPVGSVRRGQEMVGDVELLAATNAPDRTIEAIATLEGVQRLRLRTDTRLHAVIGGIEVAVRCLPPAIAERELLWLTGSRAHLLELKHLAHSRGFELGRAGLRRLRDDSELGATEAEIYRELDLPFIPPELRNGDREVAMGATGQLPNLLDRADIRGDFHMHSSWSDGRDGIAAMTEQCVALGYEYMAITDHSPSSAASRNLTVDDVERQADEIARVREQYPSIVILHGCEVDILPKGGLDFPDRVLRRFDIVLASLHSGAGDSPTALLHRYLEAMQNPHVTIITHPSNRLFPRRPGYQLDYGKLFEAAIATTTYLEIDGAPTHLDLNADLAREAAAAGAMFSVDSDAHRTDALGINMRLGVTIARRAWIEPRHVLNVRPWRQIKGLIAAKRRGISL